MRFNLTPTVQIETLHELDAALLELSAEGVDEQWIQTLRSRAEPHVVSLSALLAACHDASCRPPTSGGTGGSSPKGSGGGRWTSESGPDDVPKDIGRLIKYARTPDTDDGEVYAWKMHERLYESRGYNGKPRVVSRSDLIDMIDNGDVTEGWRGVRGDEREERVIARHLIEGDRHRVGSGVLGDGTYVAVAATGHESPARNEAAGYGDNLIRMGVPKSITENNYKDLKAISHYAKKIGNDRNEGKTTKQPKDNHMVAPEFRERQQRAYEVAERMIDMAVAEGIRPETAGRVLSDTGRVAVLLGLDGYTANHDETNIPGVNYSVVLNRASLTVDESVYHYDGIRVRHEP